VVRLPFVTSHVTFDDAARDLEPPSDVVVFDVPVESGARHRVTALAADGTRADGYVREREGMAIAEVDGYAFVPAAEPATSDGRREPIGPGSRRARPIGTVHDGFTKLK
jgi:hypothetical protein